LERTAGPLPEALKAGIVATIKAASGKAE